MKLINFCIFILGNFKFEMKKKIIQLRKGMTLGFNNSTLEQKILDHFFFMVGKQCYPPLGVLPNSILSSES